MDPVTTAVIAALQRLSEPAIRDAYQGVKALISRKFGSSSRVAVALEEAEAKPGSPGRATVLEEEVVSAAADRDNELLKAIGALAATIQSLPAAGTTIHQTVSGEGHVFSGSGDVHVTPNP
jgi:hypothetical protein